MQIRISLVRVCLVQVSGEASVVHCLHARGPCSFGDLEDDSHTAPGLRRSPKLLLWCSEAGHDSDRFKSFKSEGFLDSAAFTMTFDNVLSTRSGMLRATEDQGSLSARGVSYCML